MSLCESVPLSGSPSTFVRMDTDKKHADIDGRERDQVWRAQRVGLCRVPVLRGAGRVPPIPKAPIAPRNSKEQTK